MKIQRYCLNEDEKTSVRNWQHQQPAELRERGFMSLFEKGCMPSLVAETVLLNQALAMLR